MNRKCHIFIIFKMTDMKISPITEMRISKLTKDIEQT